MSQEGVNSQRWAIDLTIFQAWTKGREHLVEGLLGATPTVKVLIFLVLLDADNALSYKDMKSIFMSKDVVRGDIPDNTLRTSVLNLAKSLDKYNHFYELCCMRGRFQLAPRKSQVAFESPSGFGNYVNLIQDPPAVRAEDIAIELIEKSRISFPSLYFSERSAKWWEVFSHAESQIRAQYEVNAWEKLNIGVRLNLEKQTILSFVGLASGEGVAEIELLRKVLNENPGIKIHYLAVDVSHRLLRQHLSLLQETLLEEFASGRIVCVAILANIFNGLRGILTKARQLLLKRNIIIDEQHFIPSDSPLLVTYLGNCLGNGYQDQEAEIFSIIYSSFANKKVEFLIGVSVMQAVYDEYKRNWDDFLLQTPKHLLEVNKFITSSRAENDQSLPEFHLPETGQSVRCPQVIPEPYFARHGIKGQIYRFYYTLAYELSLSEKLSRNMSFLPQNSRILLYNIIKYDIKTLVDGIRAGGLFNVQYDENYHQIVDTENGRREYAVFSAFLQRA